MQREERQQRVKTNTVLISGKEEREEGDRS
jgi:hypothetical protein